MGRMAVAKSIDIVTCHCEARSLCRSNPQFDTGDCFATLAVTQERDFGAALPWDAATIDSRYPFVYNTIESRSG